MSVLGARPHEAIADQRSENPAAVEWRTLATTSGLGSGRIFCVCPTDDAIWIGTADGPFRLPRMLLEGPEARWHLAVPPERLAHPATTAIATDHETGDVWIGSLGGLTHYSAGRSRILRQINSGLANDVIYDLLVHRGELWVATAAGLSRYRIAPDEWDIYTDLNAPVDEMWPRALAGCGIDVFVAVMGAGLLHMDLATDSWTRSSDPDRTAGLDMQRNDGPVDDTASAVACESDDAVWLGTRFGLCRLHNGQWTTYSSFDSPLPDDRITALAFHRGRVWIGTEAGLCVTDGREWWVFQRAGNDPADTIVHTDYAGQARAYRATTTLPPGAILDIEFDRDEIWVATDASLARGRFTTESTVEPAPVPSPSDRAPNRPTPTQSIATWRYETPYRRFFSNTPEHSPTIISPTQPRPEDAIRLGMLIPSENDADTALGRKMYEGATLAVEQFNAGLPAPGTRAELIAQLSRDQWGASANQAVPLILDENISALIAPPGGADARLAAEIAEKLRVPTIITASGDPRLTETNSAWVWRVVADDRKQAAALAWNMVADLSLDSIAVFRSGDRFGRIGAASLRDALHRMGRTLTAELQWNPGNREVGPQLHQIEQIGSKAVVLWGNAADAANIVRHIHDSQLPIRAFGCARLDDPEFLRLAGEAAEGVTIATTWDPTSADAGYSSFAREFQARFGRAPDAVSAHAFDGARFLLETARRSGPHPARLRNELARRNSFAGATGSVPLDTTNNDAGPVWLATVERGRFVYHPVDLSSLPAWTPQSVMQSEHERRQSSGPVGGSTSNSRTLDLRIGCSVPPDDAGRNFARGAQVAVMAHLESPIGAPLVSLRVRDTGGDWRQASSALLDLALQDRVLALIALADADAVAQLDVLADACQLPVLIAPAGQPPAPPEPGGWTLLLQPLESSPDSFAQAYQSRYAQPPDDSARAGFDAATRVLRTLSAGARTRSEIRDAQQRVESP